MRSRASVCRRTNDDSATDLGFTGEAHRLNGMLNMARKDNAAAAQHFGSSVSIFDMLAIAIAPRVRISNWAALTRRFCPIAPGNISAVPLNTFRELGARLDLSRAEEELAISRVQLRNEIRSSRH